MTLTSSEAPNLIDGFDVIGDVHGHADKLAALLDQMGYTRNAGAWAHPRRQAVFVGDLIDNGPQQVATVDIVRKMEAAGSALVAMGNHEFNAIAWHRGWRERSKKNREQHKAFLDEVVDGSPLHDEVVAWFTRLPLWFDLGGLRVIHACWDQWSMSVLSPHLANNNSMSEDGLEAAAYKGTAEFDAVEILLKGPEVPLPSEFGYLDKKQHPQYTPATGGGEMDPRRIGTALTCPLMPSAWTSNRTEGSPTSTYRLRYQSRPMWGRRWSTATTGKRGCCNSPAPSQCVSTTAPARVDRWRPTDGAARPR